MINENSLRPIRSPNADWHASMWALICGVGLLCLIFVSTGGVQLILFGAMALLLWIRRLPELSHPLVWFIPPYYFYSSSYPLMAMLGLYSYDSAVQRAVYIHAVGLMAFGLVAIWRTHPCPRLLPLTTWERHCERGAALILAALIPVAVLSLMVVARGGAVSKRELASTGGAFLMLAQYSSVLIVSIAALLACARIRSRKSLWPLLIGLILFSIAALSVLGERDLLLRLSVFIVLLFWDFRRRPRLWVAFTFGLLGFASLPLLQSLKAVALGGGFQYSFEAIALIGQEFRAMGQNTWITLTSPQVLQISGWQAFNMEITRSLVGNIFDSDVQSLSSWYNETAFGSTAAGRGFSMVAAAFLVGGTMGVFVVYGLAAMLFTCLYVRRANTMLHMCFYLLIATGFVYAQRADLSNFIGPSIKTILVPMLIAALVGEILMISRRAGRFGLVAPLNAGGR